MAYSFDGSVDELKNMIAAAGIFGEWSDDGLGKHCFRSKKGGVLNFWASKGTVQFQGKPDPKTELESIFANGMPVHTVATAAANGNGEKSADRRTKIFIVHGHDYTALEQLELVLRRLNLDPYILQNNDGESKTIIEALE